MLILFTVLVSKTFASSKDNTQLMSKLREYLSELRSEIGINFKIIDEVLDNDKAAVVIKVNDGGLLNIHLCEENSRDKWGQGVYIIIPSPRAEMISDFYNSKFKIKSF